VEFDIFREADPLSLCGHLFDSVGSVPKVRQLVCEIGVVVSIELVGGRCQCVDSEHEVFEVTSANLGRAC
jgi:hypothetical protein